MSEAEQEKAPGEEEKKNRPKFGRHVLSGIKKIFYIATGIVIAAALAFIFFSIGRWTAPDAASVEHTTTFSDYEELPVFEIVSYQVYGNSWGKLEVEGDKFLGFIPTGATIMMYDYQYHFLLGTPKPVIPRRSGDALILRKSDLVIDLIGEVSIFDLNEIDTRPEGLFARRQIPTQYTMDLIDIAREDVMATMVKNERITDAARENMMQQLLQMYTGLGFDVRWE